VPITAFLSLGDLEARSQSDCSQDTFFIDDVRSRAYDAVCVPLTTTRWRDRWRDMCTISPESHADRGKSAELRAETWRANPAFELGEVTMTRLGTSQPSLSPQAMELSADGTYAAQRRPKVQS
jgi:type II protein arginine methyltransferase